MPRLLHRQSTLERSAGGSYRIARLVAIITVLVGAGAAVPVAPALAATGDVTNFENPQNTPLYPGQEIVGVNGIVAAPDGNVWFTRIFPDRGKYLFELGRISRTGVFQRPYTTGNAFGADDMTVGPDGSVWFLENPFSGEVGGAAIVRVTLAGRVTRFPTCGTFNCGLRGITTYQGNVWFTRADSVNRITSDGQITTFPYVRPPNLINRSPLLREMTPGPDGNLWITASNHDSIVRMTPAGQMTEFFLNPAAGIGGIAGNSGLLAIRDIKSFAGDLWLDRSVSGRGHALVLRVNVQGAIVAEYGGATTFIFSQYMTVGPDGVYVNRFFDGIDRVAADGTVTNFPAPGLFVKNLTLGPDNNIWFTSQVRTPSSQDPGPPGIGRLNIGT